jgi:hypothetical protein
VTAYENRIFTAERYEVIFHFTFYECGITAKLLIRAFYSSFRQKLESREITMNKQPAVYILASKRHGTLYIGVT